VVRRLEARYDNLLWMKQGEIARYWAAKELTKIEMQGRQVTFTAPFATTRFTVRLKATSQAPPKLTLAGSSAELRRVTAPLGLQSGAWHSDGSDLMVCFDLPKGKSTLEI
jgi:hypothetical protein